MGADPVARRGRRDRRPAHGPLVLLLREPRPGGHPRPAGAGRRRADGHRLLLRHQTGRTTTTETVFDRQDQYRLQAEALTAAILEDRPVPLPLEDSVANLAVIEAIRASAEQGRWVEVGVG
ncbi:MAG TPA: Gfo/Idh/MocA family oxidoreductase [Trueperaceae bacterium]